MQRQPSLNAEQYPRTVSNPLLPQSIGSLNLPRRNFPPYAFGLGGVAIRLPNRSETMPAVARPIIHRKGVAMTQLTPSCQQIALATVLLVMVTPAFAEDGPASVPSLTIGSAAPSLDIEHWVQNGNGAFDPVTTFVKDHVYVVEFWATWCGPCVASLPHLAALQEEYTDKQVQIISITAEDPKTVDDFLDREVRGEDEKTYRELTAAYCLTSDPDRSCDTDYMEATEQRGIPTAFIVGKDGHIEWIGHPMSMDEPLASIVNSTWDRERFATEFEQLKRVRQAYNTGLRGKAVDAIESLRDLAATTELDSVKNSIQQAISQIQKKLTIDSLKSSEPSLAELEQQLAAADTRELFRIVGQIGQLLTRERKAIVKYDEVVSTMLGGLEKRFNGENNDQMIAKIYANAARLADSPERGAARIEEFLKTYDGPASPLLKHVADSLRNSASGDAESDETVVTGSGLEF